MALVQMKGVTENALSLYDVVLFSFCEVSFWLSFVLQLLQMTDVTATRTVRAVLPIRTGASGVMTRSAFQQIVTVAWWVFTNLWLCY